ncbi:MAG: hypothetical protein CVU00_00290 [Bacteroidetes bacterium HGW-Bacteroidetes-17]|nr:MAG: hypothetical protein CVU00_00290 [Bacteroidetes bacterium HGW-Bacteroidetes-17]
MISHGIANFERPNYELWRYWPVILYPDLTSIIVIPVQYQDESGFSFLFGFFPVMQFNSYVIAARRIFVSFRENFGYPRRIHLSNFRTCEPLNF